MCDNDTSALVNYANRLSAITIDGDQSKRFDDNKLLIEHCIADIASLERLSSQRRRDLNDLLDEQTLIVACHYHIH